jgi:hypothetical protein
MPRIIKSDRKVKKFGKGEYFRLTNFWRASDDDPTLRLEKFRAALPSSGFDPIAQTQVFESSQRIKVP